MWTLSPKSNQSITLTIPDHSRNSPHTHSLARNEELTATTLNKWNGKPRLECVNGQHPPDDDDMELNVLGCRLTY